METVMPSIRALTGACLGAALLATANLASAVVAVPQSGLFSGALVDFDDGTEPAFDFDFTYDTAVAQVGSPEAGFLSKAMTEYGANRAFSAVSGGDFFDGPFTYAVSAWADRFTMIGGSGDFVTVVSVTLSGEFAPASYSAAAYGLFAVTADRYEQIVNGGDEFIFDLLVSGPPSEIGYEEIMFLSNDSDFSDPGPGSFTAYVQLDGTYGQPLYLLSVLATYAEEDGEVDMFSTALFGITGPAGATIETGSGMAYAPAVPEPGTYAMCAAGLAMLFAAHRRNRRRD